MAVPEPPRSRGAQEFKDCTLRPEYLEELNRSAIPEELAREAGLRSINGDEAYDFGFRGPRGISLAGLLFPYLDVKTGQPSYRHARLKPDRCINDRKYLQPAGELNRFYFPPRTTELTLGDTSRPILIVEGEKKALSVEAWRRRTSANHQVIGIGGAQAWLRKVKGLLPDGTIGKVGSEPIQDFDLVKWRGRAVYICLDGDVATNVDVMWAETHLANAIRRRGAEPWCVRIPPNEQGLRQGADDILAGKGDDAWNQILSDALQHHGRPLTSHDNQVFLYGDGIFRLADNGYEKIKEAKEGEEEKVTRVTNFTVTLDEVIHSIDDDGPTHFRATLRVAGHRRRALILDDKTLADPKLFRASLYRTSIRLEFPSRLSGVIPMLSQRLGPPPAHKVGVMSIGLHGEKFVFPSTIIEDGEIRENFGFAVLNTDRDLLKYDLPLVPIEQIPEIGDFVVRRMITFHVSSVMLPILGIVGLIPIQHHFGFLNFVPFLIGKTGSGKTLVMKLLANFFADYPLNKGLPSVTSTINALEHTGYHLPGLPLCVDDLKRQWLAKHTPDLIRLLQGTHDRHGRLRLDRTATRKINDYFVRGMLILSGEDFPVAVASAMERTLQIAVPSGCLPDDYLDRISEIDTRREDLRGFMAHYIAWTQRLAKAEGLQLWKDPGCIPKDPRLRPYCILVLTGLHYLFRFLQEECGINPELLDKHFGTAVDALCKIVAATRRDANEEQDEEIFVESVRELVASGVCRIGHGHRMDDQDERVVVIGEQHGDVTYLLPTVTIEQIRRIRGFSLNPRSVGQALKECGHLAKLGEADRPQINARFNGKIARVFAMKTKVLFPSEEEGHDAGT